MLIILVDVFQLLVELRELITGELRMICGSRYFSSSVRNAKDGRVIDRPEARDLSCSEFDVFAVMPPWEAATPDQNDVRLLPVCAGGMALPRGTGR